MKKNKERVYKYLQDHATEIEDGFITNDLAKKLHFQRSNMSTILNELVEEKRLIKSSGRPVRYFLAEDGLTGDGGTVFHQLIGGNQGSLQNHIDLAKASLMYPGKGLSVLLVGARGTGKTYFAQTMYQFAHQTGLLAESAPFLIIDGKKEESYPELSNLLERAGSRQSCLELSGGILYVQHLEFFSASIRHDILQLANLGQKDFFLICSISDKVTGGLKDTIWETFPVKLEFPRLENRGLKERFEFIQYFLSQEAEGMKREIVTDSDVLRCLLLYSCTEQLDQLQQDIQLACATAFMRDIHRKRDRISVFLGDFPTEVRKGILFYEQRKQEIETLVTTTGTYIFKGGKGRTVSIQQGHPKNHENIYQVIEHRRRELKQQGLVDAEINELLSITVENRLTHFAREHEEKEHDREVLERIAGSWLVEEVEEFLMSASDQLGRIFPTSLIHALSLHLSAAVTNSKAHPLSEEKLSMLQQEYAAEYQLSMDFLAKLEEEFSYTFDKAEVGYITHFLIQSRQESEQVAVLLAMHGSGTAQSVVQVVNSLLSYSQIRAYDMQLDKDLVVVYEELKVLLQQLDQGKGVLVVYDMGSLRLVLETIGKETGIRLRFIQIPLTLIALEIARRVDDGLSLEELHQAITDSMTDTLQVTQQIHRRETRPRAIITLCMSGEGAALVMKDYIEQKGNIQDTEVVALALSDKRRLFSALKRLKKRFEIVCIVGTYNPHIFGIPFVSIATLYTTPIEQLEVAMYLQENVETFSPTYEEVYHYLKEQQPGLDVTALKRYLPSFVKKLKSEVGGLKLNQEVGLFVHMASLISRLQTGGQVPKNPNTDRIITSQKRLYYQLVELLQPLEEEFGVTFPEDELANIISVVKEI